ncbi:MAG: phytanoyl-CoA dioxygenase family protein [Planctomycetota bacterium]|nr:phytanoyl-CoA dioxygenase family protein [Planctomycetota bacterium]
MPAAAETLASTELSPAELAAWKKDGFHVHGKLFDDAELEVLRAACEGVIDGRHETGSPPDGSYWRQASHPLAVRKFDNAWKADRTIEACVTSERLGRICAQLLGAPGIRLWHDQIAYKPPGGGHVVTWHQDWAYWQVVAECETVTCWIALDDVTADQGPMVFMAGSHRLGLFELPRHISGNNEEKPDLPEELGLREVPALLKAGEVSFHHGKTLHGSGMNHSPRWRKGLVSHAISSACTYRLHPRGHPNETWMKRCAEYPQPGESWRGPQFPMLWPKP